MKKISSPLVMTVLSTAILSACGGGSSNSEHHQPTPSISKPQTFQSGLISTLKIEEKSTEGTKTYHIDSQSTTEPNSQHVYTVSTELANNHFSYIDSNTIIAHPTLTQNLIFELQKDKLILEISYNPILDKPEKIKLIQIDKEGFKKHYTCLATTNQNPQQLCDGIVIDYDKITGTANLTFNQSRFTYLKQNDTLSDVNSSINVNNPVVIDNPIGVNASTGNNNSVLIGQVNGSATGVNASTNNNDSVLIGQVNGSAIGVNASTANNNSVLIGQVNSSATGVNASTANNNSVLIGQVNSSATGVNASTGNNDSVLIGQVNGSAIGVNTSTGNNSTGGVINIATLDELILTGTLKGTLSIAPKNIQDIPKASTGTIIIDGKTHQIISAFNRSKKIIGSTIANAGISALLDNGDHISFVKTENQLLSYYRSDLQQGLADLQEPSLLSSKDSAHMTSFNLLPSIFKYVFSNVSASPIATLNISGNIEAPLAQQTLDFSPKPSSTPANDKNNPWYSDSSIFNYSTIPDNFKVRVINHDTVEIENDHLSAVIQDKKLKSLKFNYLISNLNNSSSAKQLFLLSYQCGDTAPACTGVTVEPNGFGVKFNNTILNNLPESDHDDEHPLPPAIILNGGLVYLGR